MLTFMSPQEFDHGGGLYTLGWVDPGRNLIGIFLAQRTGGAGVMVGQGEMHRFAALANAALID
jgi:hypothetical protein